MAKVNAVIFHSDFCQDGIVRFEMGKAYAKNAETDRCVVLNFGEVTKVDEKDICSPNLSQQERYLAEQEAADKAAAEAEKLAAEQQVRDELIQTLQEEIATLEANLAEAADEQKPTIQSELEAKQQELAKLQSV